MSRSILVTCATGRQGRATVRALLQLPKPPLVLAVTRDSSSSTAQGLLSAHPEIKLVQGDLNDVPALFTAAERANGQQAIWGVFSVQLPQGMGIDNEVQQGKAMIDESLSHGIKHFVYTSVDRGGEQRSWNNATNVPHFATKHEIELYLREQTRDCDMSWTVLRPTAFMDNLVQDFRPRVFLASLKATLKPEQRVQWIAVRDIGIFAARAFEKPQDFHGRALSLAGDELTVEQLLEIIGVGSNGYLTPAWIVLGYALKRFSHEMGRMIEWYGTEGYQADIPKLRRELPDLMDMKTWFAEESTFKSK